MGCIRPGHRRRPGFFNIFHRFIHISAKIGGFPGGFWGKTGDRFPLQGGRGGVRPFQRPQQSPGGVPKDRLALRRLEGRTLFSAGTGLRRRLGWGKGHRGVARLPLEGGEHPIVLAGWTFTSTWLAFTWSWSTQPGNLPTIFWFS